MRRKEYFVLVTMNPETIRMSELNYGVISLDMLMSLGQPKVRLRRYDGTRQRKEVWGEKRGK